MGRSALRYWVRLFPNSGFDIVRSGNRPMGFANSEGPFATLAEAKKFLRGIVRRRRDRVAVEANYWDNIQSRVIKIVPDFMTFKN